MGSTAVVSDSTHYLPSELVAEHDIAIVSLYVSLGGRQERESEMPDYDDFYARLRESDEGATTSQPSVGDFTAIYEPLLGDGKDIVSVHIGGEISGTVESAKQAAAQLEQEGKGGERIQVFDTRSAAGGVGIQVLAAAKAAQRGRGADDVVAAARAAQEALEMWFAVDTLEYLRKGGRIGSAQAWVGTALKIRPILTMQGEVRPIARVRTSARAQARLREYARERHADGADAWVVQHIQAPQQAEQLASECRELFGREALFVSEIGPVVGAHAGPGLLGIGGVPASVYE